MGTSLNCSYVTVIIPTLADTERAELLDRAINSVNGQRGVNVRTCVVINGDRFDRNLKNRLEARPDIDCYYYPEAHVSRARGYGRRQVCTPFFAFLDDDDYLLPNSCRHRLEVFEQHPEADVVATNGYLDADGQRVRHLPNILQSRSDPLLGMFREMWLGSASGMFRTETIGPDLFDLPFRYFEWTVTSFFIAENYHVILDDTATYVIEQQNISESKSDAYFDANYDILKYLLSLKPKNKIRKEIRKKLGSWANRKSNKALSAEDLRTAWKYHIISIYFCRSLRFISYTRKLLFAHFKI